MHTGVNIQSWYFKSIGHMYRDGLHIHVNLVHDVSRIVSHDYAIVTELQYHSRRSTSTNATLRCKVHPQAVSTLKNKQLIITPSAHLTFRYCAPLNSLYRVFVASENIISWKGLWLFVVRNTFICGPHVHRRVESL